MTRPPTYTTERLKFEKWLKSTRGLTTKSAHDCWSRCKRIDTEITDSICDAVSNQSNFRQLITDIHEYSLRTAKSLESAYSLCGTLRNAAKRYAEFKNPAVVESYKLNRIYSNYDDLR